MTRFSREIELSCSLRDIVISLVADGVHHPRRSRSQHSGLVSRPRRSISRPCRHRSRDCDSIIGSRRPQRYFALIKRTCLCLHHRVDTYLTELTRISYSQEQHLLLILALRTRRAGVSTTDFLKRTGLQPQRTLNPTTQPNFNFWSACGPVKRENFSFFPLSI